MTSKDQQKLLDIYKDDREMRKLILELEVLTNENKWWTYTKVIVPSVLMTAGFMVACVHLAKLSLG